MKNLSFIIILLVFIPYIGYSANYIGTFDDISSSARAAGMGNAFIGLSDDPGGVYYNPAGISQIKNPQLALMYKDLYSLGLISCMVITYVQPIGKSSCIGISWRRLGTSSDEVYFMKSYSENTYRFTYAAEILPLFYIGGNFKFLIIDYEVKATSVAYDVGVLLKTFEKHLNIGVLLKDINSPKVRWQHKEKEEAYEDTVPMNLIIGGTIRPNNYISISMDYRNLLADNHITHIGIEGWLLNRILSPKAGVILRNEKMDLSCGMGIKYKYLKFDYAFEYHNELNYTHAFGLSINF